MGSPVFRMLLQILVNFYHGLFLLEQVLPVNHQLLQNFFFSALLRSKVSHEVLAIDLLGADCSTELYFHYNSHSCIAVSRILSSCREFLTLLQDISQTCPK